MPTSPPAYISHQGQVPIEIDHAYSPVVVHFQRRKAVPTGVKKTAGAVAKTFGVPDISGSLTLLIPAAGLGFDPATMDDFTISYPWGGGKYLMQHCSWSDDDRNATPSSGDSTMTLNFIGTSEVSI